MVTSTAIEAANVSFGYDGGVTLTNLSFTVGAGEMVALIGPNGSGKTTLLKVLLGFLQPSSGAIALFNSPLSSYAPKERAKQIAYVSQQPTSSFPLTVFDLVALGRYPYASRFGLSAEDRRLSKTPWNEPIPNLSRRVVSPRSAVVSSKRF